jgi:hypothetical protein
MSRIRSRRLVAALAGGALVTAGVSVFGAPAYAAGVTITKVSPLKVAATTAGAAVTITGTGFDDATITQVDLNGGTDCSGASKVTYIVVSSTTIVAKTPSGGCAVTGSTTTPETVKIWDNATTPVVSASFTGTPTTGLFFVAPQVFGTGNTATPTADSATVPGAYVDSSAAVADPGSGTSAKVVTLASAGGQTIRVNGYNYPTTITATLGGKALTGIKVATSKAYFTAKVPAIADSGTSTLPLVLTANGVSKSFFTQLKSKDTPLVSSVSPTSVAVNAGSTTVTINGSGFSTTPASNTVTICGVSAGTPSTATKNKLVVTMPTVAAATTAVTNSTLAADVWQGICQVKVTVASQASPVTVGSALYVVNQ